MRISSRVLMVGSGVIGMRQTDDWDCSMYLLDGGSEYALIDAGGGRAPEQSVAIMERCGVPLEKVRTLLLTHLHADHAAGARFWRERYGMQVVCAAEGASWLETADPEKTSAGPATAAGVYPPDFNFPPCPVDRGVHDGDVLQIGDATVTVLNTPGHSRAHLSFLFDDEGHRALFGGDVVFTGGRVVLQNIWDCFIQEYAATMARLHELHIERLYPGHFEFLMQDAHRDIAKAHDAFTKLGVPRAPG